MRTKKQAAGAAQRAKEQYWREKIRQWQESGKTQAEFCREQGLKKNSFSVWKIRILERDAKVSSARSSLARKVTRPVQQSGEDEQRAVAPAFLRFGFSDCQDVVEASASKPLQAKQPMVEPSIVAEFFDANSGRRLRIFSGADQSLVNALLSTLSAHPVSMGF